MLKVGAVLLAGFVSLGGWAVVTVKDLPEYFVAGQQYTLEFQVRQHGRTLMNDVHPRLVMNETTIDATRIGDGTYAASFTAPLSDRVTLTIISGWGASNLTLYSARVVSPDSRPAALSASQRGQTLFVAKGCNACHSNSDLADRPDNQSVKIGPELGGRHLAREYVMQKIRNPNSQIMPNLGLSDAEAAAIATFLAAASPPGSAGRASR